MVRRWISSGRRRHKRRLEVIEAKSVARARRDGARNDIRDDADLPAAIRASDAADRKARVQRLIDTHDDVTRRWLDYELDVAKLIAFPSMSDGRQALTAAFLRAKKAADSLRPASVAADISAADLAEYREAVNDYELAFDIAERDARRVRDSNFSADERKRLDRAQQLLQVAIDESATTAERQSAYRRVRQELDGLIALSDEAVERLEEKVAPELESRRDPLRPPPAV